MSFLRILFFVLMGFSQFQLHAQCSGHVDDLHSTDLGTHTTGDVAIDNILYETREELHTVFGIKSDFYIHEDIKRFETLTLCSSLHPEFYDGTIQFGKNLLNDELWTREFGEHSAIALLAHAYVHIYQCKINTSLKTWKRELQADFLAGYFIGRNSYKLKYDIAIIPFATNLFEGEWYNPFYYGTPIERSKAMIDGYHNAQLSLENAYQKSLHYFHTYKRIDPKKSQMIRCDLCNGKKTTDAPASCDVCSGAGEHICYVCEGTGKFEFEHKTHRCNLCDQSGKLTCRVCSGKKMLDQMRLCPQCLGKGEVHKEANQKARP